MVTRIKDSRLQFELLANIGTLLVLNMYRDMSVTDNSAGIPYFNPMSCFFYETRRPFLILKLSRQKCLRNKMSGCDVIHAHNVMQSRWPNVYIMHS